MEQKNTIPFFTKGLYHSLLVVLLYVNCGCFSMLRHYDYFGMGQAVTYLLILPVCILLWIINYTAYVSGVI